MDVGIVSLALWTQEFFKVMELLDSPQRLCDSEEEKDLIDPCRLNAATIISTGSENRLVKEFSVCFMCHWAWEDHSPSHYSAISTANFAKDLCVTGHIHFNIALSQCCHKL